ncbi:MAG: dihydrolipoyl dehydrogenase [Oligoflexia bacterium]|nr:dihydrolipoyl dehydrogenase [Oligoflexia bacterium]
MSEDNFYDLVIIGGGPGGYTAAIRASQLGKKVALIEKDKLGGVCLNRGCIPTKALIKAATLVREIKDFKSFGIEVELCALKGEVALARAREVAERVGKGVASLMKKNAITVISGEASIFSAGQGNFLTRVMGRVGEDKGEDKKDKKEQEEKFLRSNGIIIATGGKYKTYPGLEHDGKLILGAFEALALTKMPRSLAIIGAGAIGMEFAYFFSSFGTEVHVFEKMPSLLPMEDGDSSKEVERACRRYGINFSLGVEKLSVCVDQANQHRGVVVMEEDKQHNFDLAIVAVGMQANLPNWGDSTPPVLQNGFIAVDDFSRTNIPGMWAIGDVSGPPLLAHVAAHQGVIAAEDFAGKNPYPLDRTTIPSGVYLRPEVALVGESEESLKKRGVFYKIGKIPFMGNGKAVAANEREGHVKVLLGEKGELLGAHIVGAHATELIQEYALLKSTGGTDQDLYNTIHSHPTLSEWLAEAVLLANGRAINF